MTTRAFIVGPTDGMRLDAFAARALPDLSRRLVHALIAAGAVRVNARRATKGTHLRPGDVVLLDRPAPLAPAGDLPVRTLWEDATVVVVEKPGGLAAHAIDPRAPACVAAWLLARYPETAHVGDPLAPGLVHRLDTGTSGVLAAARTPAAWTALRAAFRQRRVAKEYHAIVIGQPPRHLVVDTPLAHDPRDHGRMRAAPAGAQAWAATTEVTCEARRGNHALLRVRMRTGVTHQVRAHLAAVGFPIVGDTRYGGPVDPRLAPGRHALHAHRLAFPHPSTDREVTVTSPLPADLAALWAAA